MNWKITILLVFLVVTSSAAQETLVASIHNSMGEPIIGANVFRYSNTVPFLSGTGSDLEGRFEIEMEEEDSLRITYIGYEDLIIGRDELETGLPLILLEQQYELETIIVSARGGSLSTRKVCSCYPIRKETYRQPKKTIQPYEWTIYPNPVISNFSIRSNEKIETGYIEILDSKGSLLRTEAIRSFPHEVSIGDYPAGMYLCRYRNAKEVQFIGKIVKVD